MSGLRHALVRFLAPLASILLWYVFSVGLTYYNRWLLRSYGFHFPITLTMVHMTVNWTLCWIVRAADESRQNRPRTTLNWRQTLTKVVPCALMAALDIALSNSAIMMVTVILYTMIKASSIVFLLGFAILFRIERFRANLIAVVLSICVGLILFSYGSTTVDVLGLFVTLGAAMSGGLRWVLVQVLVQGNAGHGHGPSKPGPEQRERILNGPLDTLYHLTSVMALLLLPLAMYFEGAALFSSDLFHDSATRLATTIAVLLVGGTLAFMMNFCEYLLIWQTSGLVMAVAGVVKDVVTIAISAMFLHEDRFSEINIVGGVALFFGVAFFHYIKYQQHKHVGGGMEADAGSATHHFDSSADERYAYSRTSDTSRLLSQGNDIQLDQFQQVDAYPNVRNGSRVSPESHSPLSDDESTIRVYPSRFRQRKETSSKRADHEA